MVIKIKNNMKEIFIKFSVLLLVVFFIILKLVLEAAIIYVWWNYMMCKMISGLNLITMWQSLGLAFIIGLIKIWIIK